MKGNDLTSVELLNFTEDMQELGKPVEVKYFYCLEKRGLFLILATHFDSGLYLLICGEGQRNVR